MFFQTDKPVVSFICDELQNVYIKLLKMIAHRSKVDEINGPRSLLAIELNKYTLKEPQSGNYPAATALNASKPDALQKKNIMKDFRTIIQLILKKMKEKSPLNHQLVCKLVTMMYENNNLTADEADKARSHSLHQKLKHSRKSFQNLTP